MAAGIGVLYPLAICIVYLLVGPALILLNKYILSELNFPFPIFLSGLGVITSGLVAHVLVRLNLVTLQRHEQVSGILWYKRVLPVGLGHAGTLAFGNLVYLYLGVGFIQMLKSFTPVMILAVGYLGKIEHPNETTIFSVLIISLGTAATCTFNEGGLMNMYGLFLMFMAELTEAVRLLMTQFLLQNLKFGVVETQYVIAPASAFWLFLASGVFELQDMLAADAFGIMLAHPMPFIMASMLGLGINFLSFLVIQVTSSLTMKVLGTARNVCTILLGIVFFGEHVPGLNQGLGYTVSLLGFAAYNAAKSGSWDRICGEGPGLASKSQESDAEVGQAGASLLNPAVLLSSDDCRSPMKKRQNSVDVR